MTDPLEAEVEKQCVELAERYGYITFKLDKIKRSNPDQLFLGPFHDVFVVEFKRKGKLPRRQQWVRLHEIQAIGHRAMVFDEYDKFEKWLTNRVDKLSRSRRHEILNNMRASFNR